MNSISINLANNLLDDSFKNSDVLPCCTALNLFRVKNIYTTANNQYSTSEPIIKK